MTADDPLLAALADARKRKQRADQQIRLLLAYAREHVQPRPYRLADLAKAAGMSISGVRTAYTQGRHRASRPADWRLPRPTPADGHHLPARHPAGRPAREHHGTAA